MKSVTFRVPLVLAFAVAVVGLLGFRATPGASDKNEVEAEQQDINRIEWWKKTNYYHIYVRSFKDSTGDGNGDLRGIIQKLDYLKSIGVETLLMSPFYSSPMKDGGYDIDDYCGIYPMFGNMKDFDDLINEVKSRNMRMVVDFVPNHSSDLHPWFKCSERALVEPERCGRYKDYYVWVNSTRYKNKYPSNWISVFGGGPAWTWSQTRGAFYLHQFLPQQPDLNFTNPLVREEFKEIARFWLRKKVDGLRVDSAIYLVEDPEFRDEPDDPKWREGDDPADRLAHIYTRSLPESAAIVKDWREVIKEPEFAPNDQVIITEAYDALPKLIEYYGPNPRDPYAHLPFNFQLLTQLREHNIVEPNFVEQTILAWVNATRDLNWPDEDGAMSPWICWVTGNHDNKRVVNRVGRHHAAIYKWLSYISPGVPINYYGDEMALYDLPQDSIPQKTIDEGESTRLPFRGPIAWDNDSSSGGFSSSADIWLPLNADYKTNNVRSLMSSSAPNFLKTFMQLQQIRRQYLNLFVFGDLVFFRSQPYATTTVFAMARTHPKFGNILLLVNLDHQSADVGSQRKANVRLTGNESTIRKQKLEPPKKGTVILTNSEATPTANSITVGQQVDLEGLVLNQSEALLIKY